MRCKRCGLGKLYFITNIIKNGKMKGKIIGSCYICNSCGKATIKFSVGD